eukprot:Sspe_Gene.22398::Locus_8522_Transcript_1_1_Confidence_1.000_Length_1773::g.22398::m.22398
MEYCRKAGMLHVRGCFRVMAAMVWKTRRTASAMSSLSSGSQVNGSFGGAVGSVRRGPSFKGGGMYLGGVVGRGRSSLKRRYVPRRCRRLSRRRHRIRRSLSSGSRLRIELKCPSNWSVKQGRGEMHRMAVCSGSAARMYLSFRPHRRAFCSMFCRRTWQSESSPPPSPEAARGATRLHSTSHSSRFNPLFLCVLSAVCERAVRHRRRAASASGSAGSSGKRTPLRSRSDRFTSFSTLPCSSSVRFWRMVLACVVARVQKRRFERTARTSRRMSATLFRPSDWAVSASQYETRAMRSFSSPSAASGVMRVTPVSFRVLQWCCHVSLCSSTCIAARAISVSAARVTFAPAAVAAACFCRHKTMDSTVWLALLFTTTAKLSRTLRRSFESRTFETITSSSSSREAMNSRCFARCLKRSKYVDTNLC